MSTARRRRFPGVITRVLLLVPVLIVAAILSYIVYAIMGMQAVAQTSGTLRAPGLIAPVRIARDVRDIPHIVASNDHDLFFGQGYAEASDRLFQMDLLRRYVYGRLSEVLGAAVLPADENARIPDIKHIVDAQWAGMSAHQRSEVQAFADGVNAAMKQQPLPAEFHLLLYKPEPWRPKDSLAVGMATVLDLIDPWGDVVRRDAVARLHDAPAITDLYSITDPAYDAPIDPGRIAPVPPLPSRNAHPAAAAVQAYHDRGPVGSNEFAVGAARSETGHALLANDPHLRLAIPGIWYLIDLRSPSLHVAGGSLAGTPGVILGHNDDIAWGSTNGTVATESVYRDPIAHAKIRTETFHVRFGGDITQNYYSTRHGFVAETGQNTGFAVDWNGATQPKTPLTAFESLDRAHSIAQALTSLHTYPGPPQNFVIADRGGEVAYQLAGLIPDDPLWGLRVHGPGDPAAPFVPFGQLPRIAPSRNALVYTANNRMYGDGYKYRLSPNFAPPYRARRIQQLLYSKPRLNANDLAAFQQDTLSFPERDIARAAVAAVKRGGLQNDRALQPYVRALAQWDGRFDPDSHGAAIAYELRRVAVQKLAAYNAGNLQAIYQSSAGGADLVLLERVLRERPKGWWASSDYDGLLVASLRGAIQTHGTKMFESWGQYDRVTVRHPLAMLGFTFLNGATFPGDGDSYGLHVQTFNHSQSFRAVWDVGNWDAGGISIPSGESGEPASGHYTDQSKAWIEHRLEPLPFSEGAVRAATRATLMLTP